MSRSFLKQGLGIGKLSAALALGSILLINGCTNPTTTAGKVSYFTEGVITDVEPITLDLDHYRTSGNVGIGAAVGAGLGQIIGKDTEATLIGAGIGALIGGGASALADRSEGMRLTVSTDKGLILVDQPYSCNFRPGAKIRLINSGTNDVQVQVLVNGSYRTAEKNASRDCPIAQ